MCPSEVVTGRMWLKARDTLARIADMAEEEGVVFTLENLNLPVDHPGTPSAGPRRRWRWYLASITLASGSISTSTMCRSARET